MKLIIDTDAGFDVDDVGAVCLANALADNGETEIVAVGHTNGYDKGIGAVSTLMHFYGRDDVPLGAYKGAWAKNPRAPGAKGVADKYIPDLVNGFPSPVKDYSTVPTAVETYRKVLSAQPDHSVHIAAIGITTNMRDLVQSQPDKYSSLNGHDLIAQKVNLIVWMDMMYNFGCAQHDTDNWLGPDTDCRGSAKAAVMGWPASVQQIFTPVGGDIQHGEWLSTCSAHGNPCRQAFEDVSLLCAVAASAAAAAAARSLLTRACVLLLNGTRLSTRPSLTRCYGAVDRGCCTVAWGFLRPRAPQLGSHRGDARRARPRWCPLHGDEGAFAMNVCNSRAIKLYVNISRACFLNGRILIVRKC